jgi:Xaa-Pro aminopeptidase
MVNFKQNRESLLARMPNNSMAIFPASSMKVRNNDNEYPFRQDSSFYWLSGFNESDAIIVLTKGAGLENHILFSQAKDEAKEIWTGKMVGQAGAIREYQFDQAFVIDEKDTEIPKLLLGCDTIFAPSEDTKLYKQINKWKHSAQSLAVAKRREDMEAGIVVNVPSKFEDVAPIVKDLRLVKSGAEIDLIRTACEISAKAHIKLMKKARPGKTEGYLQGVFDGYCRKKNAQALAYPTIVGSGDNGTCLHYGENSQVLANGSMVLIDAGCEYKSYASDITRTFPVNGRFSEAQRQLYDVVLAAQLAGIEACKPGNSYWDCEKAASKELLRGLIELGVLRGDVDDLFAKDALKQFYPHSVGHWVGLDVHDPMPRSTNQGWIKFEPNMVVTVEPGLYIQPNHNDNETDVPAYTQVDPKWLGVGIRIEDVIQITADGNDVLSKDVPKHADEIEQIMRDAYLLREKPSALTPILERIRLERERGAVGTYFPAAASTGVLENHGHKNFKKI